MQSDDGSKCMTSSVRFGGLANRDGRRSQSFQPASLQFVTGHYQSSEERRKARTLIRTHAANVSRWRQWTRLIEQHDTRTLGQQANPSTRATTPHRELPHQHQASQRISVAPGYEEWTTTAREQYEQWLQQSGLTLSIEHYFDTINLTLSQPVEELSVLPRDVTLNALQQVYAVLDQTFLPSKQGGYNMAATSMMQQIVSDVGLFHSFVFAQLVRNKAVDLQVTQKSEFQMLACYSQAVDYINSRLGNPQTQCDDSTILAVLLLAYSGKVTSAEDLGTGPTQGPLKSLQLLDLYGGIIDAEPTHEQGLARMLHLRGGMNRMMPGLGPMLSYGDVILASRRMTRPGLPFLPAFEDDHDRALRALRRTDRVLSRLGNGFKVLTTLLPEEEVQPLHNTLQLLSLYTLAVEDYITGSPFSQRLVVLADQRNLCQHSLLSLIPISSTGSPERTLIHVVRTAATIYSFLSVYPISAAPFLELAQTVKHASSTSNFIKTWREAPELAVWIIVMAAIAAIGTEHRTGFVAILDRCLSRLKIDSWEALKELLQEFLWLPSTNDADGYDLWIEVEESSPFKLGESSKSERKSLSPETRSMSYP